MLASQKPNKFLGFPRKGRRGAEVCDRRRCTGVRNGEGSDAILRHGLLGRKRKGRGKKKRGISDTCCVAEKRKTTSSAPSLDCRKKKRGVHSECVEEGGRERYVWRRSNGGKKKLLESCPPTGKGGRGVIAGKS